MLLVVLSLSLLALAMEFIVFRFIFPATDIPANAWANGLIKYAPEQRGVYRVKNEIEAPYRINGSGWNSGQVTYSNPKLPGVQRIAIVGDSFVEAFQVPFDASLAELLEAKLVDRSVEVYRYGISGAPLSQYAYMVEKEVLSHSPDLVVVVLVHNDFDESFEYRPGRYTSSFLKLRISDGEIAGDTLPEPYVEGWKGWIRQLATVRYFHYQYQVSPSTIKRGLERMLSSVGRQPVERTDYEANVSVSAIESKMQTIEAVTNYLFRRLKDATSTRGADLLIVMDGDRHAVYNAVSKNTPVESKVLDLNRMTADIAKSLGIDFVDLGPIFANHYRKNGIRFEYFSDNHWNRTAHDLVSSTLEMYFRTKYGS
jgi:hypothetical protein